MPELQPASPSEKAQAKPHPPKPRPSNARAPNDYRRDVNASAPRVVKGRRPDAANEGKDTMKIFGFHAVLARLRRDPEGVTELYVDASRNDPRMRELERLAQASGVRMHGVDSQRIERLCPGKRHQGVVALSEASVPSLSLEQLMARLEAEPRSPVTLLLLDGVTDPRNLGACLRVADGAGVAAVIDAKDHACALTEVAIQTSSGAAESVPYLMVTNLARTIDTLQENGFEIIGSADESEDDLYGTTLDGRIAWVLGAEGKGLRRLTRERCDRLVRIPMHGQVESLNVSVAAGVVLYDTLRQRQLALQQSQQP